MYSKLILLIALFIFLFIPTQTLAAVYINEISPSTDTEWIELYNDGTEINLSGYLLEDGNSSTSDDILLSGTISSGGFLVFNHNEGWLNNSGDTLKLYNNASPSAIIDQYTYGSIDSSKVVARVPNGSENWIVTNQITQNASNPTPTATATATSTTTAASTSTATSTPTKTATAIPTPTKTATSRPTSTPSESPSAEPENNIEVIGTNIEVATPTGVVAGASTTKKPPFLSILFIASGIMFLGYGGYLIYNSNHGKKDSGQ